MSHPVQFVQVERADYGEIDRLTVPPGNPRPKHRKKKIGSTPTPTPTLTRNHFLSLTNECVLVGKGSSNGGFSAASFSGMPAAAVENSRIGVFHRVPGVRSLRSFG